MGRMLRMPLACGALAALTNPNVQPAGFQFLVPPVLPTTALGKISLQGVPWKSLLTDLYGFYELLFLVTIFYRKTYNTFCDKLETLTKSDF